MRIFFLHVVDHGNSGDISACPYLYFDFFKQYDYRFMDLEGCVDRGWKSGLNFPDVIGELGKDDALIVGGGGLLGLSSRWDAEINEATRRAGLSIGWGLGQNNDRGISGTGGVDVGRFKLFGMRDKKNNPYIYLPCVSCMSRTLADCRGKPRSGVGVVLHKDKIVKVSELPSGADITTNAAKPDCILRFISGHSSIYANSYHACYWSALLDIPCCSLSDTRNTRFLNAGFDWHMGSNAGFYDDCVARNVAFANQAFGILRTFAAEHR